MIIRFLIELDAILDTRLGVMDNLDPEAAVRLIGNPAYYTRMIDHMEPLCGISEEAYQAAWKARSVNDLSHASVTPIVELIHCEVLALEAKQGLDPTLEGVELVINLYPYLVSADEEKAIGKAILSMIGSKSPVRFVRLSPKELSPEIVRRDYSGLFLYNHHDWLLTHGDELTRRGVPRVTLVAPKLCYGRVPSEEEQKLDVDKPMDMWRFMELMSSELVGLAFQDVGHFSTALGQASLRRDSTTRTPT
jgi:hypothetical protein